MDAETARLARGISIGGLVVLTAAILALLAAQLADVLAILFLGMIVGITLAPLAELGERFRVPRILSVLLLYAAIAALLSVFFWFAVPPLIGEIRSAVEELGTVRDWYEDLAAGLPLPGVDRLTEQVQGVLETQVAGDVAGQAVSIANSMFYALTVLVVALFVTITKDGAHDLVLSLIHSRHRDATARFLDTAGAKLRRYVLATFATMISVGLLTYLGLIVIGVPLAPLLAMLAFLFELLPIVGPWIAFAPAFLVALTQGVLTAVAVAVLYLVIQQVESYVLVPVIQGRETKLPGLLILSAILIGLPLMGILGALVALPVAVLLHTLATEVLIPWRRRQVEQAGESEREAIPMDATG